MVRKPRVQAHPPSKGGGFKEFDRYARYVGERRKALQRQAETKKRIISARKRRIGAKSGFVRVHALSEWFNARRVFLSRHKSKKELVSSLRELHPKIEEMLEGASIVGVGPDTGSPAIIVSFKKKKEIPEEAVTPEFVRLAKRENLGHIIGSERYASVLRVPFKAKPGGKSRSLVLMLVDEPRLKASNVPRSQVFEELRGNVFSWAAKEPSRREKKIERGLRLGPAIPMGPFYKYNALAADAFISSISSLASKNPRQLTPKAFGNVREKLEVLVREWAENEAIKGYQTRAFEHSMLERVDSALGAITRASRYLSAAEIARAIQPSKSLEGIKSSLARAIRRKQKAVKSIQKKEISKVRGKIRARRTAKRRPSKEE